MTKALLSSAIIIALILAVTATCQKEDKPEIKPKQKKAISEEPKMQTLEIKSSAFAEGQTIPEKYTCDGEDVSVPLSWPAPPEGTKSFALICDDPDAPMGTFVHWVLFNIPPEVTELPEGLSVKTDTSLTGAIEGISDFRKMGYGGPCPPRGPAHRYFFKLYALDTMLELKEKSAKADVEKAMQDHILAQGQLMGKYKR
jgi:Raf kinase inhibitor-like YbhB/YbcL family protein